MNISYKRYIVFWFSQTLSQLGSSMTGFALILWVYMARGTVMTVSLMAFFRYVPYVLASLFAGTFVDRHRKKWIMLVSDGVAAACSVGILLLHARGALQIEAIYLVNGVIGFASAFQEPAFAVAVGKAVPKEKMAQVSGLNAFSGNLVAVLSPVWAASLYAMGGLWLILTIDLASFLLAFLTLLLVLRIPEEPTRGASRPSALAGCTEGFRDLLRHRDILAVILTMALLNFLSRLTYENILSPMILARSANDSAALGMVNAAMGIGGILGGIVVATGRVRVGAKMIYACATASFLLGDLTMALGRDAAAWTMAGLFASFSTPFIDAGQAVMLYQSVPVDKQGRIFAARNAIQFCSIPAGILLGGFLADRVFEPYMRTQGELARFLCLLVGEGAGSGMAVMFLCSGILGALVSVIFLLRRRARRD